MSDQKSTKKIILLIDDEYFFHQNVKEGFGKQFHIESARDMDFAWSALRTKSIELILLDLALKGEDYKTGLPRIAELKQKYPKIPVIVVTNDKDRGTIVEATKYGADYFLYKGEYDTKEWRKQFLLYLDKKDLAVLKEKYQVLEQRNSSLTNKLKKLEPKYAFIGCSESAQEIRNQLKFLGQENVTVLITGETGVGKEVAARYLHAHSLRNKYPFQAVHLSSIQESLLESRLFGHKKGAFTDAKTDQIGLFHEADKGVLFLDEIGEISMDIQIQLLRFLEDQVIRVIGSDKDIKLDVQIIAATNKIFKEEVVKGKIREDLYQRLNVFPIEIPPLRERIEDIPLLIAHFLKVEIENLMDFISKPALEVLIRYNWPGNIRELKNAIEYSKLQRSFKGLPSIDYICLPKDIIDYKDIIVNINPVIDNDQELHIDQQVALTYLNQIEQALIANYGKKGSMALALNSNTDAIRYKVRKYYKQYPDLFKNLQTIRKTYKLE